MIKVKSFWNAPDQSLVKIPVRKLNLAFPECRRVHLSIAVLV